MADLSLHSPATYTHGVPYDYYRELRENEPRLAPRPPDLDPRGYWAVARHADVQRVSRDSDDVPQRAATRSSRRARASRTTAAR